MKIKPYELPEPHTDPKERLAYVRRFLGMVKCGMPKKNCIEWCDQIRSDINATSNEVVRTQAKSLFEQVVSAIHFPNPKMAADMVESKTENLIAYLEKHDC